MPYTPYTLQSILLPSTFDNSTELQQKSLSPRLVNNSFFSTKRPVSPTNNETLNTLIDIESVAAWDSDLYCGTHDGLILHYSLEDNKSSQDKTLATQLESTINLGLGKKPVEKILLIPQVSKAVILCGK
ncbi:uncharacterized protein BX663DRAFT_228961 [Cokeromyces recurvatus]|uniref:uncharacterized protein n=1 Tax=Cokeromyces recurvatus TaxID=90255 RepID=UPI0022203460|nr:uncharacterized protein BX663DRAFT_228961 [Cokeromyces recurvatus]KAI7898929.1 hypothetical protein BX663DRAFT_228961 [Cokeromyces recurvatus]